MCLHSVQSIKLSLNMFEILSMLVLWIQDMTEDVR